MQQILETSQLYTVRAVAMAGSFSKAAEQLNVTQSAVSQSIKNIENKLGVPLFHRSGKSVYLTKEGELIEGLSRKYFSDLEKTLSQVGLLKDEMSGPVGIGTLMGLGKSWLASRVLELSKQFQNLELNLNLGFSEQLIEEFERGGLDLLILPEEHLPSVGEKTFIGEEFIALLGPKTSDYPSPEDLSKMELEELANFPMILFESNDQLLKKWFKLKFNRTPSKINRKLVMNSHGHMLQAVSEGLGMAVMPLHVVERSHYQDQVSIVDKAQQFSNGKFYLVHQKEAAPNQTIGHDHRKLTDDEFWFFLSFFF